MVTNAKTFDVCNMSLNLCLTVRIGSQLLFPVFVRNIAVTSHLKRDFNVIHLHYFGHNCLKFKDGEYVLPTFEKRRPQIFILGCSERGWGAVGG